MYLQYGLTLKLVPSYRGCSKSLFSPTWLSCKKGIFVTLKHNKLQDSIGEMLQKVTNDAKIEPILQPLTEKGVSIDGNVSMKTGADISARAFSL